VNFKQSSHAEKSKARFNMNVSVSTGEGLITRQVLPRRGSRRILKGFLGHLKRIKDSFKSGMSP
jgi:hypothetical protein